MRREVLFCQISVWHEIQSVKNIRCDIKSGMSILVLFQFLVSPPNFSYSIRGKTS